MFTIFFYFFFLPEKMIYDSSCLKEGVACSRDGGQLKSWICMTNPPPSLQETGSALGDTISLTMHIQDIASAIDTLGDTNPLSPLQETGSKLGDTVFTHYAYPRYSFHH